MNSDDGAAAKAKASATATEEAGESADNDPRATFGGVEEERVMNDSTLPRLPMAASSAARVADSNTATTLQKAQPAQVVPRSRKKVGRFGMADWIRLLASTNDLAQRKGRPLRKIRWDEIRQHASVHDGWIVLKQKVYNISPYMVYHPGGESILKAVLGKDATALFDRYHRWVNEDGLIGKLHIGYLDTSPTSDDSDDEDNVKTSASYLPSTIRTTATPNDGFAMPPPRPRQPPAPAPK